MQGCAHSINWESELMDLYWEVINEKSPFSEKILDNKELCLKFLMILKLKRMKTEHRAPNFILFLEGIEANKDKSYRRSCSFSSQILNITFPSYGWDFTYISFIYIASNESRSLSLSDSLLIHLLSREIPRRGPWHNLREPSLWSLLI